MFLNSLSRKTNSNTFIPQLDGLRFLAIFTVVLYHLNTALAKESDIGLDKVFELMGGKDNLFSVAWWWVRLDLGVKIFFTISGFILALPFLKNYLGISDRKISIKDYFTKRLVRLEPPFIISLIGFTFIQYFLFEKEILELLEHLGAGILYSHVLIFGQPNPINPVTWSLETEAQFYFFIPLLFALFFLLKQKTAFVFLVLLMLFSALFRNNFAFHPHLGTSLFSYFINFGVGIVFAWFYLKKRMWMYKKGFLYDVLGLFSLISLFIFYKPQHLLTNILPFNIAVFMLFIATFKSFSLNWFFSRKIIYTIGGMCYSIYLLHYAFLHLSIKLTVIFWKQDWSYFKNLGLQILLNIPLVLLMSSVYFILFERPFMDRSFILSIFKKLNSKI